MNKLAEKDYLKIEQLTQEGDKYCREEQYLQAVKTYQKAWNHLPEPKQLWEAGTWLKVAQAECFLALEEYDKAKQKLMEAMICAGAVNNPLVHLLLGICSYELGDMDMAKGELQMAYELDGETIFEDEDPKYRATIEN